MSDQLDNIFTETQVVSLVEIRGMNRALMHLQRMLLTGATALREDRVPVRVEAHSERLLAVKRGENSCAKVDASRKGFTATSNPAWPQGNCLNDPMTMRQMSIC
jgi:hypothetical protein